MGGRLREVDARRQDVSEQDIPPVPGLRDVALGFLEPLEEGTVQQEPGEELVGQDERAT